MMIYELATRISPMMEPVIPFLAALGSLPVAPAKIYMRPETISATVTIVPMKKVADKTISWINSPTEVGSPWSLTLFLILRVS